MYNMKAQIDNIVHKLLNQKFKMLNFEKSDYRGENNGISYTGDFAATIHKPEIPLNLSDVSEYLPHNILNFNYKDVIKNSDNKKVYDSNHQMLTLTKKIDDEIILVIDILLYNSFYKIGIGFQYFGASITVYSYQEDSPSSYELNCLLEKDFLRSIDVSTMCSKSQLPQNLIRGLDLYNIFTWYENTKWDNILSHLVNDNVLTYNDSIHWIIRPSVHHSRMVSDVIGKDFFTRMNINAIKVETVNCSNLDYDFPANFKIEFNFKQDTNPNNSWNKQTTGDKIKRFIESYPHLSKYLPVEYRESADRIKKLQDLWKLYNTKISLVFKYKNLEGMVLTNQYSYNLLIDYYKKYETIQLDVAGNQLFFAPKALLNHIKVSSIRHTKGYIDTMNKLNNKCGYIEWWLKEFEESPERI